MKKEITITPIYLDFDKGTLQEFNDKIKEEIDKFKKRNPTIEISDRIELYIPSTGDYFFIEIYLFRWETDAEEQRRLEDEVERIRSNERHKLAAQKAAIQKQIKKDKDEKELFIKLKAKYEP